MADTWLFTSSSASIFPCTPKWQLHGEKHLANLHTHLLHSGCRKSLSHSWTNAPNRSNQQRWTRVTEQILSLAIYHASLTPAGSSRHITLHSKVTSQRQFELGRCGVFEMTLVVSQWNFPSSFSAGHQSLMNVKEGR